MYRNKNDAKIQKNTRLKNKLFSNINYQKLDQDSHIENIVLRNKMAENDVNNSSFYPSYFYFVYHYKLED